MQSLRTVLRVLGLQLRRCVLLAGEEGRRCEKGVAAIVATPVAQEIGQIGTLEGLCYSRLLMPLIKMPFFRQVLALIKLAAKLGQ